MWLFVMERGVVIVICDELALFERGFVEGAGRRSAAWHERSVDQGSSLHLPLPSHGPIRSRLLSTFWNIAMQHGNIYRIIHSFSCKQSEGVLVSKLGSNMHL